MWVRVSDRRPFAVALVGLVAMAWLALLVWGQSPYGRFLSHQALEGVGGDLRGQYLPLALVFVGGWTLMTVAMMLPTSLPLIAMFHAMVSGRRNRTWLVVLVIAGYLGIWTLFGAAAHAGDMALHQGVERMGWLEANAWALGAAAILLAGIYQFTPLKYHCLDKCRSPYSFIMEHWRGGNEAAQALRLGVHHGVFCVGCCWSLMLLMFAVGVGNIGWMLALAMVMAIEKNMPWGRRLGAPLGGALLAGGLALLLLRASSGALA